MLDGPHLYTYIGKFLRLEISSGRFVFIFSVLVEKEKSQGCKEAQQNI
jgi:hypothetical protein